MRNNSKNVKNVKVEIERLQKLSVGLAHQLKQATEMLRNTFPDYPMSKLIQEALLGQEDVK